MIVKNIQLKKKRIKIKHWKIIVYSELFIGS
jgi:hypothetical protein